MLVQRQRRWPAIDPALAFVYWDSGSPGGPTVKYL